jgi:hypothetical protein
VLGETCWEEPRKWIVMEICGEVVQRPLQVSYHVHMPLLQGWAVPSQDPRMWAPHPTYQIGVSADLLRGFERLAHV